MCWVDPDFSLSGLAEARVLARMLDLGERMYPRMPTAHAWPAKPATAAGLRSTGSGVGAVEAERVVRFSIRYRGGSRVA